MRILFKDEGTSLACIEITYIAYDIEEKALKFKNKEYTWTIEMSQFDAETKIKEIYQNGATEIECDSDWEKEE